MTRKKYKPVLLLSSPVEFVITGPYGGRDRVLVKSKGAGMDLTGMAQGDVFGLSGYASRSSIDEFLSFDVIKVAQINVVGRAWKDVEARNDNRNSFYKFAWRGLVLPSRLDDIHKMFNLLIPDLYIALHDDDVEAVEFILSPLVLNCKIMNQRRVRSRKLVLKVLLAYVLSAISVMLFFSVRDLFLN